MEEKKLIGEVTNIVCVCVEGKRGEIKKENT